mgnify:CR=1 FL=1
MKDRKKANLLFYRDINEGASFSFEKKISQKDVNIFADLTGDYNPLHTNKNFGKKSRFGKNIAHGLMVGSLFSKLVGMYCPGEKSLYVAQTFNFREPIFIGDKVTVNGVVTAKNDSIKLITLKTEIWKESKLAINGEAKVAIIE